MPREWTAAWVDSVSDDELYRAYTDDAETRAAWSDTIAKAPTPSKAIGLLHSALTMRTHIPVPRNAPPLPNYQSTRLPETHYELCVMSCRRFVMATLVATQARVYEVDRTDHTWTKWRQAPVGKRQDILVNSAADTTLYAPTYLDLIEKVVRIVREPEPDDEWASNYWRGRATHIIDTARTHGTPKERDEIALLAALGTFDEET